MNPYDSGQVKVVDKLNGPQTVVPRNDDGTFMYEDAPGALVEYRTPVNDLVSLNPPRPDMCSAYKCCTFLSRQIFNVEVDLDSVLVRPTAYSLRLADNINEPFHCHNWNLEASQDGNDDDDSWDVLHAARNDHNLKALKRVDLDGLSSRIQRLQEEGSVEAKRIAFELPLSMAEEKMRHTWDIDTENESSKFYRFFRLKSVEETVDENGLDVVGFELFGEIHEP